MRPSTIFNGKIRTKTSNLISEFYSTALIYVKSAICTHVKRLEQGFTQSGRAPDKRET